MKPMENESRRDWIKFKPFICNYKFTMKEVLRSSGSRKWRHAMNAKTMLLYILFEGKQGWSGVGPSSLNEEPIPYNHNHIFWSVCKKSKIELETDSKLEHNKVNEHIHLRFSN